MRKTNNETKKIATLGILCAAAYLLMFFIRIPIASIGPTPLNYEPKDVIIVMGGFLYGPLYAFMMSVVVSLIEMVTISTTGIIGCVMNVVSTTGFACTASFIYRRKMTLNTAVIGLTVGVVAATGVMLLWNWLLVPVFMKVDRAMVVPLLLTLFAPFNLVKYGINAVLAILLFKPVMVVLNKANLIEPAITGKRSTLIKWIFVAVSLVAVTVLLMYVYNPPAAA